MIRVLHILPTLNVCGGIENFVMNYYRAINKDEFQFDFIVHELGHENFKKEIENLGGKVFLFPQFSFSNFKEILKAIKKFSLYDCNYDIVHCHMINAAVFYFFYLCRYTKTIKVFHSHQTVSSDRFFNRIRNYLLVKGGKALADEYWAVSNDAGKFLFGSNTFRIVGNAINVNKFQKSKLYRKKIQADYGLENKFIIGHVGRFAPIKNHKFLLQVMKYIVKDNNDVVLCLVGAGELKSDIQKAIHAMNLNNNVYLLPICKDVYKYYGVFDVLLLPSLYEGFGLVTIEAQYAGVHVIASKGRVPAETQISNYIEFLPLEAGEKVWKEHIMRYLHNNEDLTLFNNQYDIAYGVKHLEQSYNEILR